jgi:hypothetical protein
MAPALFAVAAVAAIASGVMQNQAAQKQAKAMEQQGDIQKAEMLTAAAQKREDTRKFQERQILAFTKNGVMIQGSPLLVLSETMTKGNQEADAMVSRGYALESLADANASATSDGGKAALVGSLGQAASYGYQGYAAGSGKTNTKTNTKAN